MDQERPDKITRRRLLQAGCSGLGLALTGAAPPRGYQVAAVADAARISGVVRYAAQAGRPALLKLSGDCEFCRKFGLRSEALLQGPRGGLQNVVVYLSGIRQGKAAPAEVPTMAEDRCTFSPHVLSMGLGKLRLLNRDPVLNTFHAVELSTGRTIFNIGMPRKDQQALRRVRRPGVIKMLCDVHPWEVGYVLGFEHPYHAVSDARGRFTLDQVPPGRYTLGLWHEQLGRRSREVQLGPGAHLKLELTYPTLKR